jgi:glycerophosphoryl diester phosphodiesterase
MPLPHAMPWRIAHRGARDQAPENTRSAFERALDFPIDGIELDVRLSADDIPFIFHDATLRRLTGRRTPVEALTHAQLEALDWGGWFHPDFSGEPLATLAQTLALFASRTRLLIEIKAAPSRQRPGHAERLTRRVVDMLAEGGWAARSDQIYILSFDPQVLRLAHRLAPQWRFVLNAPELSPLQAMLLPQEDIDRLWGIDVRIGRLTAPMTEWAKSRGLRVFTYTCNGPRQVQKALRLGVDAILSDRPGWLTQYLDGLRWTHE